MKRIITNVLEESTSLDQIYVWNFNSGGSITWNIRKAQHILSTVTDINSRLLEVERDQLEHIFDTYDYNNSRAMSSIVNPKFPGIAAPVQDGNEVYSIVIDGIHRAVKAFVHNVPFKVVLLTPEESRSCILEYTDNIKLL